MVRAHSQTLAVHFGSLVIGRPTNLIFKPLAVLFADTRSIVSTNCHDDRAAIQSRDSCRDVSSAAPIPTALRPQRPAATPTSDVTVVRAGDVLRVLTPCPTFRHASPPALFAVPRSALSCCTTHVESLPRARGARPAHDRPQARSRPTSSTMPSRRGARSSRTLASTDA